MNRHDLQDLGGGTISGLLASRASWAPQNPALVFAGQTYSYRELDDLTTAVGAGLMAMGFKPGDVSAALMTNRPETLVSAYGGSRAGLVRTPINTAYKGSLLQHVLEHSESKLLFMEASFGEALLTLPELPPTLRTIVCLDGVPERLPQGKVDVVSWEDMLAAGAANPVFPEVAAHDVGGIGFTSGTTGKSKGVVSPHLQQMMMARETAAAFGVSARDRMYTCMPLFHGMASVTTCATAIYAGATILLSPRFSVTRFWDEVREGDATQFNCLGSIMHMLLSLPPSELDRRHEVQRVFSAPAPAEVLYRFEHRFGVHVIEGYGQTEIKNVLYNPIQGRKIGSMGLPTPSTIMEVHDEEGNRCAPGEVGEMVYRPRQPNIMMHGYLKEPEKTLAGMKDLWWHTGDLASQDGDGFFYFFDRKGDSLRRRGENISSQELEGLLVGFPGVKDAAAVATPSEIGEDEVLIVLEVADPAAFDFEALRSHCSKTMPKFMIPRYVRLMPVLPRTPTGKVQKALLRKEGVTTDTWDGANVALPAQRS